MAAGGGSSVTICGCFGKGNGALVELRTLVLNGLFGNASMMPEAVYEWVLSTSNSGPPCTSAFVSVTGNTMTFELWGFFVFIATHTRRGASSSFEVIMSCASYSWFLCYCDRSSMPSISTYLNVYKNVLRSGAGEMLFTKLSVNEVPSRTGTTKWRKTPKTTLILETFILTCSDIDPTTWSCWLIAFFKAGCLFACVVLGHSVSKNSSQISFGPAPASNKHFTKCVLLGMGPTEIEKL